MVKGGRLRTCCRRAAWVRTPPPALTMLKLGAVFVTFLLVDVIGSVVDK